MYDSWSNYLISGPVEFDEKVLEKMSFSAVSHVDPSFIEIFGHSLELLRTIFNSPVFYFYLGWSTDNCFWFGYFDLGYYSIKLVGEGGFGFMRCYWDFW